MSTEIIKLVKLWINKKKNSLKLMLNHCNLRYTAINNIQISYFSGKYVK